MSGEAAPAAAVASNVRRFIMSVPGSGAVGRVGFTAIASDVQRRSRLLEILQKINVQLATVPVPRARTPGLRDDIDVAIVIHVAHLQFMATELRVEDDAFAEFQLTEILPNSPARVLAAIRQ